MGTALLQGWVKESQTGGAEYAAHVLSPTSAERLRQSIGLAGEKVRVSNGKGKAAQSVAGSDVVLLGVAPGDLDSTLAEPGLITELQGKILVSMLAGVSTSKVQYILNSTAKQQGITDQVWQVARIIPTLAATIGESVTLLTTNPATSEEPEHIKTVERVFSSLGTIQQVPENLMNEATAIGAAMHALTITAIESATDASVADGVPRSVALALAARCLRSCSGLMSETGGMSPEQVKAAMSTPGGITLNSIVKLDENVRSGIAGTVRNAIAYTRKMSG